jgi:hypothetical protein
MSMVRPKGGNPTPEPSVKEYGGCPPDGFVAEAKE